MPRIAPRLAAALCAASLLAPAGVAHAAPSLRPAVEVTHLSVLPGDGDTISDKTVWKIDYPYRIKWGSTTFTDVTTGETMAAFYDVDPYNAWHFQPVQRLVPGHTYRMDLTYTSEELPGVHTQTQTNTVEAAAPAPTGHVGATLQG